MLARIPKKTANIAVAIIGTPGTKYGVIASASTQAERASMRSVLLIKRGQRSPKNAAGTAASKPQAAGLPIACAPSAPAKVKIFQKAVRDLSAQLRQVENQNLILLLAVLSPMSKRSLSIGYNVLQLYLVAYFENENFK